MTSRTRSIIMSDSRDNLIEQFDRLFYRIGGLQSAVDHIVYYDAINGYPKAQVAKIK